MEYEAVIGLEVHAQLLTHSKIFCGCPTEFGPPPNSQACPICLGMPGVLPVINKRAVEFALRTALALSCEIAAFCRFARKHYFYPDMPKNYQISQYELPLAQHGFLFIPPRGEGGGRKIGIQRLHLEEDVGKLVHAGAFYEATFSLVDFNRSGVPLMEIVSEPDIKTPEEAAEYLRHLRAILIYLDVCDGNMEEGSLRCDANVSVRAMGSLALGVKVEIKNMNSFKAVKWALEYEIKRQTRALEEGGKIVQETRLWDADKEMTLSMRSKEYAHDYRYFPEPDLAPLEVPREWIQEIKRGLPELPEARKARFVQEYGIPDYDASVLTSSKVLANYYEECVRLYGGDPKTVSNWVMVELLGYLNKDGLEIPENPITPEQLAELLSLMDQGVISIRIAKQVFEEMYRTGKAASEVVKEQGLHQISDVEELARIIHQVLQGNPGPVADFKKGKEKSFTYLVGQVMKATKGRANPKLVNNLLQEKLKETGDWTG